MTTLISIFPTALYHTNISVEENFQQDIENLEYLRVKNDNGFISKNYHLLENASYANFKKNLLDHTKTYLYDILKIKKSYRLEITTSWANKHSFGDYSQEHNHNNSIVSGIYYTNVNEESGDLIFTNPFSNFGLSLDVQLDNYGQFNSNEARITPKNGDLFLFPSALKHRVDKNRSTSDRFSIAFNIMARGTYGIYERELLIS
jgi:uncharacterized protein (TIGR02466 family)